MSEESDVDLDMEGVVEVNFNLIWDNMFGNELKLRDVLGKVFCKFYKEILNSLHLDFFFAHIQVVKQNFTMLQVSWCLQPTNFNIGFDGLAK